MELLVSQIIYQLGLCFTSYQRICILKRVKNYREFFDYYSLHADYPPNSFCDTIKIYCLGYQNPNKFDFYMTPETREEFEIPNLFDIEGVYTRNRSNIKLRTSSIASSKNKRSLKLINTQLSSHSGFKPQITLPGRRSFKMAHLIVNQKRTPTSRDKIFIQNQFVDQPVLVESKVKSFL